MSIFYRLHQNNVADSKMFGKWYGRARHLNTVNLAMLAEEIQANTTAKAADVYAVLKELVNVMQRELLNSNRVKIDGLGTFKVSFSSAGADSAKEYNAKDCIKKFRILFQPEYGKDDHGRRDTPMLRNAKAQELPYNDVKKETDDGGDTPGGDEPNP